jgi:cytochrome c oxidase subunit 2
MKYTFVLLLVIFAACGSSKQFDAIPPDFNRQNVPNDTINVTAESFKFTPEVIRAKAGTLVTLRITSIDGTHGFRLSAFGIDERLDENVQKSIEFYASKKGEYDFRCSHFCGLGHLGMTGKIIVE